MTILSDPAAERAVCAAIFAGGGEVYADIADIVGVNSFTIDSNASCYKVLEKLCRDSDTIPDYPSFLCAASDLGLGEFYTRTGEIDHLRTVMNTARAGLLNPANARKMAARIRKLEVARLLDGQLDQARGKLRETTGEESIDQILSAVEGPIFDFTSLLSNTDNQSVRLMGDGAEEYLTHLLDNPREMIGISTGMKRLDRSIGGGLRPGSLDLIAARAKAGKSMLSDNIALSISGKLNIPVLNLDTEMSWEEHLHRIAANMAGVPSEDIETGKVKNRGALLDAAKKLKTFPYHYRCITGEAFEETLSHMRRWVLRTVGLDANGRAKPCVIIYDYLKLMNSESMAKTGLAEYQMLGFLTTALKNFAGRYGVPILAFAQLNRDGVDKEDVTAISQSDRVVWFCTSLTIYKRKSDEEKAGEPNGSNGFTHKLVPIVCRHGAGLDGGDYINVKAEYKYGRIKEGPLRSELEQGVSGQSDGEIITGDAADGSVDFAAE